MDAGTLRIVVIAAIGAAAALWLLLSFVFRVGGTWERELDAQDIADGVRAERMELAQLGPFVTGRRVVPGGHQELSGLLIGYRLTLSRRDYGVRALMAMGFPDTVAPKVEGQVTGRFTLHVVDSDMLSGAFEPRKIEFTHQPPRVTSAYFLEGQPRTFRRMRQKGAPVDLHPAVFEPGEMEPSR